MLICQLLDYKHRDSFSSECFPYGGYYNIREGWTPRSQYAFMFSSPQPGNSNWRSMHGNNIIDLTAFGQELLVAGEVNVYDNVKSPMLVDGKQQFFHAGIPEWGYIPEQGHRHMLTSAWEYPSKLRWHTSACFDLAEVVYAGPYNTNIGDSYSNKKDAQINHYKTSIAGVKHQRLLTFVRQHGFWIVTDRMSSDVEHRYTQLWRLPVEPLGNRARGGYKAFDPDKIVINQNDKNVKTEDPEKVNLSIYHYSSMPLNYSTAIEVVNPDNAYKVSDFYRLGTTFSGLGDQLLITVLYPRETIDKEIAEIKPLLSDGNIAIAGFEARLNDGTSIRYLAASDKNQPLKSGSISMTGESILLVKNALQEVTGTALGCKTITIDGVPQHVTSSDFEFKIVNGALKDITNIYTPIDPVKILPGINVFSDEIKVTMSCGSDDVDICYSTDGTEPTPLSTRYNGPVTLTENTVVKACAFRKGVKQVPETKSGTYGTPVARAVFTKKEIRKAKEFNNVIRGLNYEYYEGNWRDLFAFPDSEKPVKKGIVPNIFDISAKKTGGPFAFKYTGFIKVPGDGVYTFYAPDELMRFNIVAGYDLQVFIDDEQWYPSTRRHALGTWSVPLEKGSHKFTVKYVDYRGDTPGRINIPRMKARLIWDGVVPDLMISGPSLSKQVIPENMLFTIN